MFHNVKQSVFSEMVVKKSYKKSKFIILVIIYTCTCADQWQNEKNYK